MTLSGRRSLRRSPLYLSVFALLAGCGGGGGGGGAGGVTGPTAPTVTVAAAASSVTTTQTLGVNVTVSGAATGMVTLTSGAFSSGALPLSAGQASLTLPAGVLPVGSQTLSVAYTPASTASSLAASGTAAVTVSAGAAPSVTAGYSTKTFNGRPFQAIPLGSNVLVSVSSDGTSGSVSGIKVFDTAPMAPAQLTFQCTQLANQPGFNNATAADGLTAFPNGMDLAVAAEGAGVTFLNATETTSNCSSNQPTVSQLAPGETATARDPGTFGVAVTPDGKYAFVANEYGVIPGTTIMGDVGVVSLQYDASGHVSGGTLLGQIPTGGADIANVTLSPDGSRLYVTSEVDQPGVTVSGTGNTTLNPGTTCLQGAGSTPTTFGLLSVIDVAKAEASPSGMSSTITTVASGCGPVRVVETSDQEVIYVAARGDNRVLAFSTHMLESNPDSALLGYGDTGGIAPVGLQLFHNQQLLAVANSNRFSNPVLGDPPTVAGNMTIMSAIPVAPAVLKTVTGYLFPRNISVAADDATLYLTDYTSELMQVVSTSVQ